MRNRMKKWIAMFLCLAMAFSLLPAISVKADGTNSIYIASSAFENADVYYSINEGSEIDFSTVPLDGTNRVLTGIALNSVVKIKISPKNGSNIGVSVKEGASGAGDGGEAGNWNSETNTYTLTTSEGGGIPRDYLIKIEVNNNNSSGNGNGGSGQNNGASWEDQYTQYFAPGINILSQWIGNSEGNISYSFSADNSTYTNSVTLDRSTVENCLSNVTDANKGTLFGISTGENRYVKIKTGRDLGGNHLGFEIYAKDSQGNWQRNDSALSNLKYWSYIDETWKDFGDNSNYEWEDYLKSTEVHNPNIHQDIPVDGLILDVSGLSSTDAIRCLLPFDSRKNVSWWNAKYKGEVAAAGDQVSDDNWVENGTVELVKVTSEDGSQVYFSNEPDWEADPNLDANMVVKIAKAGYDMGNDQLRPGYDGPHGEYTAEQMLEAAEKASGQCNIPVNAIATVMLTPDPGYQILTASLNGMTLTPDAGTQSMFSFKVTSNIHFEALFEEAADVVDVGDAEEVASATIGGTADVVDSGNLALTVKDDSGYDDAKALAVVDGEAVASLNIEVDQIVAKAGNLSEEEQAQAKEGKLEVTEDKFWKNNLTDLNNPVDIELVLDNIAIEDGEELALVRDHNGECQEIPLDVNIESGQTVASFSSEKFSTYTIIKKSGINFIQTVSREDAEDFVSRMYTVALGRTSDEEGLDYWCDQLVESKTDAASIAYGFFFSPEYQTKNLTNEQFVEDLYQTILGRKSDSEGKAHWVKALEEGMSRTAVLSYFVNSKEFSGLCDNFNIPRGTMERDGSSICNAGVRQFVLRNYAKALERKGESSGIETWCYLINNKKMTPAEVTESFFRSQEFINKELSDESYIEVLYETFLGRGSDSEGKAYWLESLKKGQSRDEVMKGFSNSAEFSKIVAGFGL